MWAPTLDLFNCIDLVAIRSDRLGVMGIQVCGTDVTPHIHKILKGETKQKIKKGELVTIAVPPNPYLKTWLEAGNPFFIWSWRPLKEGREVRSFYRLREIEFKIKDGIVVAEENPDVKETVLI